MALRRGPRNVVGELPTRTPLEAAERLRGKMRELHGGANRRRATAEAARVLVTRSTTVSTGRALTPRNEDGESPTRSLQETAERLAEKLGRLHGAAIRRRIAAKAFSA